MANRKEARAMIDDSNGSYARLAQARLAFARAVLDLHLCTGSEDEEGALRDAMVKREDEFLDLLLRPRVRDGRLALLPTQGTA